MQYDQNPGLRASRVDSHQISLFLDWGPRGSTNDPRCCSKPLSRHIRSRRPCDNRQSFVIAEY
jgi:hypothetical protein